MRDLQLERGDDELRELTERASALIDAEPAEAFELARRARGVAERLGNEAGLARSLYLEGASQVAMASYAAAEAELLRALEMARAVDDRSLMVSCLRALLKSAFLTRNNDAALVRGLQALQLARDCGNESAEALTHNDLGLIYGNLGDFEGALEHLLAGLRMMRERGSPKLSSLLNNIGNVYLEVDDHDEALTFFHDALEAARREGTWRGEAIVLGNIGRAWSGSGDPAQALAAYEQSLAIYRRHGDRVYLAPALARAATALAELGRDEDASETFDEAFATLEAAPHREFGDEIYSAAGRYSLSRKDPERAIEALENALALIPSGEQSRRVAQLHGALSDAFEDSGDLADALRHFKEYHRVSQALSDTSLAVRIRGLMMQFDVERARQQEEIIRLRNVELAEANEELQALQGQLEAQNRELHQISIEDSLTNLYNRRYLDLQLGVEISRAQRHHRPLCAAMCDIDHFKDINDRFSHAAGDEVLRRIAGILRETARVTDVISRYGGEEFLLILPDTDLAGAEVLTERLRTIVAEYPWRDVHPEIRVTFSIGVAEMDDSMDAADLLAAADARLYEAKRSGRDRVVA